MERSAAITTVAMEDMKKKISAFANVSIDVVYHTAALSYMFFSTLIFSVIPTMISWTDVGKRPQD